MSLASPLDIQDSCYRGVAMVLIIWVMACEPPSGTKIAGRQPGPSATPLKGQAVGGRRGLACPELRTLAHRLPSHILKTVPHLPSS